MKVTPEVTLVDTPQLWLSIRKHVTTDLAADTLVAQWALETGWGRQCKNWNLGNVKCTTPESSRHTYYRCGEELPLDHALRMAKDPRVEIVRRYRRGATDMASVTIRPEHPACCFRAYATLEAGVEAHVSLLQHRFGPAWELADKPQQFAEALHGLRYYTADPGQYARSLIGCARMVRAKMRDYYDFIESELGRISDEIVKELAK